MRTLKRRMAFTRRSIGVRADAFLQPLQPPFHPSGRARTLPLGLVSVRPAFRYGRLRERQTNEVPSEQVPTSAPRCDPHRAGRGDRRGRGGCRAPRARAPASARPPPWRYAGWRRCPMERIPVSDVRPLVDGGTRPAKSVVDEEFTVRAKVFREGHDAVNATAVLTAPDGREHYFADAVRQPRHLGVVDDGRRRRAGLVDLPGRGVVRPLRDLGPRRRHQDRGRCRRGAHVRRGRHRARALRRRRARPGRRRLRDRQGRARHSRTPARRPPTATARRPRPRSRASPR